MQFAASVDFAVAKNRAIYERVFELASQVDNREVRQKNQEDAISRLGSLAKRYPISIENSVAIRMRIIDLAAHLEDQNTRAKYQNHSLRWIEDLTSRIHDTLDPCGLDSNDTIVSRPLRGRTEPSRFDSPIK